MRDHLYHYTFLSRGTCLVTGYFVWYTYMGFTMKTLTAAALGLHLSNIMVMLCEVTFCCYTTLWLHYGCCYGFYVSQERGCHLFDSVAKTGRKIESVVCTIQPSSFHRYPDFGSFNSVFHVPKLGSLVQCFFKLNIKEIL